MIITLTNAHGSINRFLVEAKGCAAQQFGFAAMLTAFPVMLSVSEALGVASGKYKQPRDAKDEKLFGNFVPHMAGNKSLWFVPRKTTQVYSDHDIAKQLCDIRNSLAHQHSLPNRVWMANSNSEVQGVLKSFPHVMLIICVVEFVDAVQLTIDQLISRFPNAPFDPFAKENEARAPAVRVVYAGKPPKT